MTMPPNQKVRVAYRRGCQAAQQSQDCDCNPYNWIGAEHGGVVVAS